MSDGRKMLLVNAEDAAKIAAECRADAARIRPSEAEPPDSEWYVPPGSADELDRLALALTPQPHGEAVVIAWGASEIIAQLGDMRAERDALRAALRALVQHYETMWSDEPPALAKAKEVLG